MRASLTDGSRISGLLARTAFSWQAFRHPTKWSMDVPRVLRIRWIAPTSIICDQTGVPTVFYSSKDYPAALRRIRGQSDECGKRIAFLTNNTPLKPERLPRCTASVGRSSCSSNGSSSTCASNSLGTQRERREDTNLVRRLHLRAHRHREETLAFERTVFTKSYKSRA